jgi:hypothetical protein
MFNKFVLITIFSILLISCSDDRSEDNEISNNAYDEAISDTKSLDDNFEDDCEKYDDCDFQDTINSPDTEGYYALSISDGYFGDSIKGEAAISSVLNDNGGIKTSGFLIFLTNDNDKQSSIETINITLLRIGDETRQLQVGNYPLVYGEPDKDVKQYGSFSIISSDLETTKNIAFIEGNLIVEEVDDLEYEINDAMSMYHDVAKATVSVTMHDKAKDKNFTITGDMRVVSIGKMITK